MMKFCERFHLSPFEYMALPIGLIELWSKMTVIEEQLQKIDNEPIEQ